MKTILLSVLFITSIYVGFSINTAVGIAVLLVAALITYSTIRSE